MASASVKKPCVKCTKGAGVATCDGCQQSFCVKHFAEHRQELSYQMENIGHEHDLLRRDLDRDKAEQSLARINTWEHESIVRIQIAAEAARADLHELLDRNGKELRTSLANITDELQAHLGSNDYTEIDIKKWLEQLQELRKILESPPTFNLDENETSKSIIRLIRVRDQRQVRLFDLITADEINSRPNERFDEAVGEILISEEGLVATCDVKSLLTYAVTYGANRYSTGIHRIRFRINEIENLDPFFGIVSSTTENRKSFSQSSFHGWWNLCGVVANGKVRLNDNYKVIRTDDELTLIVNCDNRKIELLHHRTNGVRQMEIDLYACPFPWRIVVELQSVGDCVRILQ